MATKKTKTLSKKITKKVELEPVISNKPKNTSRFFFQLLLVILIGVAAFFLAKKYRHLILVGTVNTTPISRWQLNSRMMAQYGKAMIEEMVNETLLKDLARQNGIQITDADIKAERDKVAQQLGGEEALANALTQYGLSEADFVNRLKTSLIQQKLAEKQFTVEVTDEQVQKAFTDNKTYYEGKKLEDVKDSIIESLKQQDLQQKFTTWFEEQKTKAKINLYL